MLLHRVVCLAGLFVFAATAANELESVRELRLRGELPAAIAAATDMLDSGSVDTATRVRLHLELAKIHDRVALHNDTRPAVRALEEIQLAERTRAPDDEVLRAELELAYADNYYRAEMGERLFVQATAYANRAIAAFAELGDHHGHAEAVHRLGLIHLQKRELDRAHESFEESLRLDKLGGAREVFRGEYERHVGFVYALREDAAGALPHFERSLEYRIKAGAIDASLFAAVSLAAVLVELERYDEAGPHLDYALEIADRIDSPVGRKRAEAVLERLPAR